MKAIKISFYMLAMTTGFLLIPGGCQEESISDSLTVDQQFYVFSAVDQSLKAYEIGTLPKGKGQLILPQRGPNASANGHVSIESGLAYSFSAMENRGGVHGQLQTTSGWPGVIESMHIDSDCITTVDNQAFFGGVITQIEVGPYQPFTDGWQAYFAVEDNGAGNYADPDRYGEAIFFLPPGLLVTDVLPAEYIELNGIKTWCDLWPIEYSEGGIPFVNGEEPTNVQVK